MSTANCNAIEIVVTNEDFKKHSRLTVGQKPQKCQKYDYVYHFTFVNACRLSNQKPNVAFY